MIENLEKLASKESKNFKTPLYETKGYKHWDKYCEIYGAVIGALPGLAIVGLALYCYASNSPIFKERGALEVCLMGSFFAFVGAGASTLLFSFMQQERMSIARKEQESKKQVEI